MINSLQHQVIFEFLNYIYEHHTPKEFKNRFVFGVDISRLFEKAFQTKFKATNKHSIGMNTDRVYHVCKGIINEEKCKTKLFHSPYHLRYCANCLLHNSKSINKI